MAGTGWKRTRSAREDLDALKTSEGSIVFAPPVPETLARSWLARWRDWFGVDRVTIDNASHKRHLAKVESEVGTLVAKRDRPHKLRTFLQKVNLRTPRGLRSFWLGRSLRAAGVRVPEPLACLRVRGSACLLSRWVDGESPWSFLSAFPPEERETKREQALRAIAETVSKLHSSGFRNRDLKEPNLLIDPHRGELEVWCVDLDGVASLKRSPTLEIIVDDLAPLYLSFIEGPAEEIGMGASHWQIFLDHYLARSPAEGALRRVTIEELAVKTERRLEERFARRGRVSSPERDIRGDADRQP